MKRRITPMGLILAIMLSLTVDLAIAQQLRYLGLGTQGITTIAVDWSTPDVIYAGSWGGIFKSMNGGATWDTLTRRVYAEVIAIHPANANILYVTLGTGIIRSTDAGRSWSRADSGVGLALYESPGPLVIDPKHPDTLYTGTAGGGGGYFYRSTNGGRSWHPLGDSTRLRNGVTAIAIRPDSPNVLYAATTWTGDLLKSTDYGVTWSILLAESLGICYSIECTDNNPSTFYVSSSAIPSHPICIFKTTDDGLTWGHPLTEGLPDTIGIYKMQIYDSATTQLFLVGRWQGKGGIFQSTDGKPWRNINSDARFGTLTLSGGRLYAGGAGVYVLDVPTSVPGTAPSHSGMFNLDNNFPNPFNPSTQIVYEIGQRTEVLLEIYDIQGKKVKALVQKEHMVGTYSATWDGRDERGIRVTSGAYFYVLRTAEQVSAKRMINLR